MAGRMIGDRRGSLGQALVRGLAICRQDYNQKVTTYTHEVRALRYPWFHS